MKTLILALSCLACLAFLFALVANAILGWVYWGEPDTNGDPERDGCPLSNQDTTTT